MKKVYNNWNLERAENLYLASEESLLKFKLYEIQAPNKVSVLRTNVIT